MNIHTVILGVQDNHRSIQPRPGKALFIGTVLLDATFLITDNARVQNRGYGGIRI